MKGKKYGRHMEDILLEKHKELYGLRTLEKELKIELKKLEEKIDKVGKDIMKVAWEIWPEGVDKEFYVGYSSRIAIDGANELIIREIKDLK